LTWRKGEKRKGGGEGKGEKKTCETKKKKKKKEREEKGRGPLWVCFHRGLRAGKKGKSEKRGEKRNR